MASSASPFQPETIPETRPPAQWEDADGSPVPSERVSASVRRLGGETDWDNFLPARASSLSWKLQQGLKRLMDVVGSLAGLVILSPLLLVCAALVKLTSRGPLLYPWRVLGFRATPFCGYKFRTMVPNAEALRREYDAHNEMHGPVFKMRSDPRVTRVGVILRKYSLDELPQLWSVLKGDMSLVGPRPVFPDEFVKFEPWHRGKLAVKPGLTCLWQISGRSEIYRFDDWAKLDKQYIQEWSLLLDLRILLLTIPAVVRGHGAY